MPILDIQQRARELGRIRIGTQVTFQKRDGSEGRRPAKLDAFRFTTPSEHNARMVAELFGGDARSWEGHPGQWEVVTDATELPVVIPPGHGLTQHYELWSGGGLQRRCNGLEKADGSPCVCPREIPARMAAAATGGACKPTSRLQVLLPDLVDLGVWLLVSHGYNAALELSGAAELLEKAAGNELFLPAKLRLEQRSKTANGKTNHYGVPVLEVGATLRALTAGEYADGGAMALPPPPGMKALPAGHTQPPPPQLDEPAPPPVQPDEDDGIVDAEIVEDELDPETVAQHSLACETRDDVQQLLNRAAQHGLLGREATHPISGRRMVLREILQARWQELST